MGGEKPRWRVKRAAAAAASTMIRATTQPGKAAARSSRAPPRLAKPQERGVFEVAERAAADHLRRAVGASYRLELAGHRHTLPRHRAETAAHHEPDAMVGPRPPVEHLGEGLDRRRFEGVP